MARAWLFLAASAGLLVGCGETCASTCAHVYDPSECGITHPGIDAGELVADCTKMCNDALQKPGDMGSYDPTVRSPATETIELETDQQAAAWIDCVWNVAPEPGDQATCQDLDPGEGGICAPI